MFLGLNKLREILLGSNSLSFVDTHNYTHVPLPELESIDLSSCNLKEYPAFLRFHNKMKTIYLINNSISFIPEWTWNRNQETLEFLNLERNSITSFHHQVLPWVHLKMLGINNNQLQGRLPIPPQTIVVYDASDNSLSGEIPSLICELTDLSDLRLSSNNMTGTLPHCLGSFSNSLAVLDLHKNHFQGTMMDAFLHGCQLKMIDLSDNQCVGQVPKSLANCIDLEILSLGGNSFSDLFPFWAGTLLELQVLSLRSNKFYGAIQGPTAISSQFPKLRIIDLSNNGFHGHLPDMYFQIWNAMKSVEVGTSGFMQSVTSTDGFQIASMFTMYIVRKGVKTEYTKILNVVTAIDLSCNHFEGEIPQALQDLHKLQSLNLSNNHLIGPILSSLGNLMNLEALDLSQNKLSGEIPQQLV